MKQLLEDTLKAIKESGHREEDVDYVGSLDGRLRVSWWDARTILDIDYPDFAPRCTSAMTCAYGSRTVRY